MLTLNDGRSELWQWDTGRKLTVDADCSQVHFSNKVFGRSIDVDVVDGIAIIPDILLQTDKELTAWAFVGTAENGYTKISKVFKVNKRNKPADYVFTPPEQTTLQELVKRFDAIEESQDPDAIKNAVEDYLEQNPVEAPVQSVNGETGKVKLTAKDVGAISQDDLQEATNEVLAQAKASGEFNGEDGITPHIGANGNWYLGETDTGVKAQGEDGKDGAPGKDGYTPVKGVDYFDGKDGKDGIDGADGKDGDDYVLTDADKTEIAELASEMVDIPEGGGGIDVSGATVGQTVKISAVDDSGVPTAWEAVDLPSGGGTDWTVVEETVTIEGGESGKTGGFRLTPQTPKVSEFTEAYIWIKISGTVSRADRLNWNSKKTQFIANFPTDTTEKRFAINAVKIGDRIYARQIYDTSTQFTINSCHDASGEETLYLALHWSTIAANEVITCVGGIMYR